MRLLNFFILFLTFIAHHNTVLGKKRGSRVKRSTSKEEAPLFLPPPGKPITIFIPGGAKPVSSVIRLAGFEDDCPQGFYLIRELQGATNCLGRKVASLLSKADPKNFSQDSFYVFGWSSLLSTVEREKSGRELFRHLKILRSDPRYADTPLTIIAYSHGGNVALGAAIAALEEKDESLLVDRLITLACPVVSHTENFINSSIFKEVIVLFSKSDVFQASDPQAIQPQNDPCFITPFFSKRRFDPSVRVIQAEVKFNNRSRTGHLGFIGKMFLRYLPQVLNFLTEQHSKGTLKKDTKDCYCVSINTRYRFVEACRKM